MEPFFHYWRGCSGNLKVEPSTTSKMWKINWVWCPNQTVTTCLWFCCFSVPPTRSHNQNEHRFTARVRLCRRAGELHIRDSIKHDKMWVFVMLLSQLGHDSLSKTVYFTKCWGKSVRCRLKFYNLWPLPLNNHQLMFMKTFNNLSAVYPSILYRSSNSVTFLSVWVEYGCTTAAPPGHHCADSKWHRQCKMAALRSRICWLHFSTEGGSGDQRFKLNLDCCLNFNSWHSNEVSVSY